MNLGYTGKPYDTATGMTGSAITSSAVYDDRLDLVNIAHSHRAT
jgi:hypothetical protein